MAFFNLYPSYRGELSKAAQLWSTANDPSTSKLLIKGTIL
jgi:hypothetical protein